MPFQSELMALNELMSALVTQLSEASRITLFHTFTDSSERPMAAAPPAPQEPYMVSFSCFCLPYTDAMRIQFT